LGAGDSLAYSASTGLQDEDVRQCCEVDGRLPRLSHTRKGWVARKLTLEMPTLFKSDYATLEHAMASRLVRVVRSNKQFEDAVTAKAEVARWSSVLDRVDLSELGLLLDWRQVPLSTDPDVLREVVAGTDAIGLRFVRHAVLMTTPLGALQAQRLQRVHASHPEIFTDEEQAYGYVMGR
jgi:hypothetical protein